MKAVKKILQTAVALLPMLAGCSDSPLQPVAEPVPVRLFSRGGEKADVVKREASGPAEVESGTLGQAGGRISAGGVTLFVPRGALEHKTLITLSVGASGALTVELEPHGLQFARAAALEFDLKGTPFEDSADLSALLGVYHMDGVDATVVTPLELLGVQFKGKRAVLSITHFSDYSITLSKGLIMVGG